jgi:hypothetical protein
MKEKLSGSQRRTYDAIFSHPLSHNLEWHDVLSMLGVLGEAVEEHNGKLQVKRDGQTLVLHGPRGKDVASIDELMKIRHFLEETGDGRDQPVSSGTHLLVVIDHREARVYKTDRKGSIATRIAPDDPHGFETTRMMPTVSGGLSGRAFTRRSPRRSAAPTRSCCSAPAPVRAAPWTTFLRS